MIISKENNNLNQVSIKINNNRMIERIQKFKYFSSYITPNLDLDTEIKNVM